LHKVRFALIGVAAVALLVCSSVAMAQDPPSISAAAEAALNSGTPAPKYSMGDLDGDQFVTALDLGNVIDILFASAHLPEKGFYPNPVDLDFDTFVTALDLGIMIDVLFAGKNMPPEHVYELVGRSGPGVTYLLWDDSVKYTIGGIGGRADGGIYEVGSDSTELGLADGCPKTDTLIIPPGVRFYGSLSIANPSAFIVRRTGFVHAVGDCNGDPIVFGSLNECPNRNQGDWGGMVINGCACNNDQPDSYIIEAEGNGGVGGGNDIHDNSGNFKCMRVEFAGREFTVDNELNGITVNSVGNGTLFEYLQVNQNDDDGIEWFGGRVDCRYTVLSGIKDDGFDSDFGAQWRGQYLIVHRDPFANKSSNYNGFEWDNQPTSPYQDCPRMKPTIWNATLIGNGCTDFDNRHDAAHIRRGADGDINNTVWTEWHAALEYDEPDAWDDLGCGDNGCYDEISLPGNPDARIEINNSIWYSVDTLSGNAYPHSAEFPYMPANICIDGGATCGTHPNNVFPNMDCGLPPLLTNEVYPAAGCPGSPAPDYTPLVETPGPLYTGINDAGDKAPPNDGWFDPDGQNFKGAAKIGGAKWWEGWTDFSPH
jgi:hypothetical protein